MSRRARIAISVALGIAVLAVLTVVAANTITDRLWFSSLGFTGVYDRTQLTKTLLYLGFGVAMGALVAANVALSFALRPLYISGPDLTGFGQARVILAAIHRRSLLLIAVLVGLGAGRIAAAHWQTFLMWRNGGSFGVQDPQFHRDAGFYVFVLPWWHFLAELAMVALILCLLSATFVHYLYGGLRLQPTDRHLTRAAGLHLAGIGAAILVVKGIQTWLGRYDVLVRPGADFSGLSYVGYHAILPGQAMLAWMALVCAVVLVVAAWRSHWLFSTVAIGLYVVAILVVGVIWPAVMRSTSVDGQVASAEKSFVAGNITATRAAYGLRDVVTIPATATAPTKQQLAGAQAQLDALRSDGQESSTSLGVLARAEVGYYPVADNQGKQTELLLSVRRIQGNDLLSAAYAAPVSGEGAGWWSSEQVARNLGLVPHSLAIDPARSGYEAVPSTGQGTTGGYSLSSWFARAAAAVRYADPNLLNAASTDRLADLRQPLQRVQKLAPWLTLDSQVYPAVVDGRVVWILDGYTTSASYPNSQVASLAAMTTDSQNPRPTFGSGVDSINYIRDGVKVVVDAASGSVSFYAWDEQDPILKAMRAAFPGMIRAKASIPPQLAAVLRYPTTLFSLQRSLLTSYRLTDPAAFLAGNTAWETAVDPSDVPLAAPPSRGLVSDGGLPAGALTPTMTALYTDASGAITEAYLTVNSDSGSAQFGQLELHVLPATPVLVGPTVAAKRFAADARVVALVKELKTMQTGAVLTVPVAGGLLQTQTLYGTSVQPGDAKAFVATFGGAIGYGPTLAAAITDIAESHPTSASASSVELVRQARDFLAEADVALAKGDRATYDAEVARAKALLEKALQDPAWKVGLQ